jgi:hypothetical protein
LLDKKKTESVKRGALVTDLEEETREFVAQFNR